MHPIKELKSTCTRTSHTFNLNFKSNANLLPSRDADNPQVGFSPLTRENSPSLHLSVVHQPKVMKGISGEGAGVEGQAMSQVSSEQMQMSWYKVENGKSFA